MYMYTSKLQFYIISCTETTLDEIEIRLNVPSDCAFQASATTNHNTCILQSIKIDQLSPRQHSE